MAEDVTHLFASSDGFRSRPELSFLPAFAVHTGRKRFLYVCIAKAVKGQRPRGAGRLTDPLLPALNWRTRLWTGGRPCDRGAIRAF